MLDEYLEVGLCFGSSKCINNVNVCIFINFICEKKSMGMGLGNVYLLIV